MNKISIDAIHNLVSKIAETLPDIGHKPGFENHFFSNDYEEFIQGTRSDVKMPCMGLNFRQESSLPGNIKSTGTNSQLRMNACVCFLADATDGEYEKNRKSLDTMFQCLRWVYDFLEQKVSSPQGCNYPLVELWDVDQGIRFYSVSDAGFDEAIGWIMFIPLRESLSFGDINNPLNNLVL